MKRTKNEDEEPEERCPACGYCKHCGQSRMSYPYPTYYPQPIPCRVWYTNPNTYTPTVTSGATVAFGTTGTYN